MPIYEYACKSCGQKFEKLVRNAAQADDASCPKCNSKQTARALSVFATVSVEGKPSAANAPPMCGRCGGPGPCAIG